VARRVAHNADSLIPRFFLIIVLLDVDETPSLAGPSGKRDSASTCVEINKGQGRLRDRNENTSDILPIIPYSWKRACRRVNDPARKNPHAINLASRAARRRKVRRRVEGRDRARARAHTHAHGRALA